MYTFIFPWERDKIIQRLSDVRLLEIYEQSAPTDLGYKSVVKELEERTNPARKGNTK